MFHHVLIMEARMCQKSVGVDVIKAAVRVQTVLVKFLRYNRHSLKSITHHREREEEFLEVASSIADDRLPVVNNSLLLEKIIMGKWKSLLTSRRFWVSAVGLASVVASEALGIELNQEQLIGVVTIVVAWVIGDTVRETK